MKKWMIILVCLVFIPFLTWAQTKEMRTYDITKVDFAVTTVKEVETISYISDDESFTKRPETDKKFLLIYVTVHNGSQQVHYAKPHNFILKDFDVKQRVYKSYSIDSITRLMDNGFNATNLLPKTQTSGWLVFQIKASSIITRYRMNPHYPTKLIYVGLENVKVEKNIMKTD